MTTELTLESELHKLRIDKSHKASHQDRAVWPWALVALLLVGGAVAGWQFLGAKPAVAVETLRIRMPEGAVSDEQLIAHQATGYIIAAHKIELAAKVIGRVAWVGVEMGDKIEPGQALVRLEDDEYKARVAQETGQLEAAKAKLAELEAGSRPEEIARALANLDEARAQQEFAERNLKRLQELSTRSAVSRQELDDAETTAMARAAAVKSKQHEYDLIKAGPRKEQIDAQRAVVKQLEGALAMATIELNNTVIKSPIAGRVLERNVEVGEFVTTGFVGDRGAKGYVVSIADLNDLRVELDISQNNFSKVRADQDCWIATDAYPDAKFAGRVDLISPEANRQKATVLVRVKVLNPDERLKPDMNASVSFLHAAKQGTTTQPTQQARLSIPGSSVRAGAVLVVENGKAIARPVVVGASVGDKVEIRSGLIGGEDLILNPSADLKDGDPVQIRSSN